MRAQPHRDWPSPQGQHRIERNPRSAAVAIGKRMRADDGEVAYGACEQRRRISITQQPIEEFLQKPRHLRRLRINKVLPQPIGMRIDVAAPEMSCPACTLESWLAGHGVLR